MSRRFQLSLRRVFVLTLLAFAYWIVPAEMIRGAVTAFCAAVFGVIACVLVLAVWYPD